MTNNDICVPEAALSEGAEGGGGKVTPGQGDEVEVTLKGRVTRSEGGNVYFKPETANGEPMGESKATEQSLDDEGEELSKGLHGGNYSGMTMGILLLLSLLFGLGPNATAAELRLSERMSVSASPTTNVVFINSPLAGITNSMQVFQVETINLSGSAAYLMVFDSYTNKLANAIPGNAPRAVASGANAVLDFGPNGAPFLYGINVALSTTPNTLTNAAGGGYVHVIWSPLNR